VLLISNSKFEVKLIDFGFAEKINKTKLVSKAGTPGYLPPEIFKL
jgi:serine/threonine protein kinase